MAGNKKKTMAKFRRFNRRRAEPQETKEWNSETSDTVKCQKCVSAGKTKCECKAEERVEDETTNE